ncbi:type II toxin-antitoxin system CcdA family antitoxin [uncultured Sphingomonas sp.]|uniref:type II toxin-antitoxin system CcdA family antitoxin n=1 Tax=uncultured Sphingomonas sp. TaxID=158754 RepID=UPI0025D030F9|nr:type II toxin-antitoxin system CcdA family antitoxin [uncultured Sphingomonas sp.]
MKHELIRSGKRLSVNMSIDSGIVAAAKEAGVNLSKISEGALAIATREAQDARWKAENRDWIDAHRTWVDANQLPLEKYRLF